MSTCWGEWIRHNLQHLEKYNVQRSFFNRNDGCMAICGTMNHLLSSQRTSLRADIVFDRRTRVKLVVRPIHSQLITTVTSDPNMLLDLSWFQVFQSVYLPQALQCTVANRLTFKSLQTCSIPSSCSSSARARARTTHARPTSTGTDSIHRQRQLRFYRRSQPNVCLIDRLSYNTSAFKRPLAPQCIGRVSAGKSIVCLRTDYTWRRSQLEANRSGGRRQSHPRLFFFSKLFSAKSAKSNQSQPCAIRCERILKPPNIVKINAPNRQLASCKVLGSCMSP